MTTVTSSVQGTQPAPSPPPRTLAGVSRPPGPPAAPAPPDPPMVPVAVAGTALWAVAGLAVLIADGPAGWQRICLAGFLLGLPGIGIMVIRDRRRARRASGSAAR
jgi:hypothetical protein